MQALRKSKPQPDAPPPLVASSATVPAQPRGKWKTAQQRAGELTWLLTGKAALMGANGVLMLYLADRLQLQTYGLFITIISAQLLVSRALLLGVDVGLIRLRTVAEFRDHTSKLVQAGLRIIGFSTFTLIALALVLEGGLSAFALPHWPSWATAAVVIGAVGTAFVDYGYGCYLSQLRYKAAGFVQSGTAIGRLVLTVLAVLLFPQHALAISLTYALASLLAGLIQVVWLRQKRTAHRDTTLQGRLLRYSIWQGGASIIVVLSLYQGNFLLMALDQQAATGLFGLGLTLSLGFFAVYNAYNEYLLPRSAHVTSLNALPGFLWRASGGAIALILVCVPLVLLIGKLSVWLLRPELQAVESVFYCLAAAQLLLILQCPLVAACHYLLKPHVISLAWTIRVMGIGALGWAFAPERGAMGAALAQLGGTIFALISLIALFAFELHAAQRSHQTALVEGTR
jgi:O-antigen/teichoic acid export membrane protein